MDLDEVLQDFLDMKGVIEELTENHNKLSAEKLSLQEKQSIQISSKKFADEELKKYQDLIEKYQKMLVEYTKTKEDNNNLKENLAKAKSEKVNLEQSIISSNDNFMLQIEQLEKKQRSEIDKIHTESNELAMSEISIYKDKLRDLKFEVDDLHGTLADKKREHELELGRLKLEYETNMQKFQQRQLAIANNSSGSLSARNDIFRKKLQHFQHESESEVKQLKVKCNEQEQHIADQQHQLKIGNKQLQEMAGKHRQQMEKMEKALHQSQSEICRLRGEVQHEKTRSLNIPNDSVPQYELLVNKQGGSASTKRRKKMFNPHKDRLSPTP